MLAVGQHDYYYFNYYGTTLLLTIGDTENRAARQFLNSVPEHMFNQLATAIGNAIWGANEYDVQNNLYMTYLSGQAATQRFIEIVSTESTFFSLVSLATKLLTSRAILLRLWQSVFDEVSTSTLGLQT